MSITGKAKVAGIIGWPVTHSLSPLLHGYWLAEYKVDGALVPLAVAPENFTIVLRGLKAAGFTGVNVTVPHKQAAFALADFCDPQAMAAQAANLLVFIPDGKIQARNTDATGLGESLKEIPLAGKSVVLIGTGGAARGAVLALDEQGAGPIHVLGRDGARARALVQALQPSVKSKLVAGNLADWDKAAPEAALLLNASAAGMGENPALALALDGLAKEAVVCDIVYHPLKTDLMRRAQARGHPVLDGLGMLMHQAVPSFEAFFGVRPKVTAGLRAALEKALGG